MEITGRVDCVMPKGKWEFTDEVAQCFTNMLERSIPDYQSMRGLIYKLGERFVKNNTWISDIGCSTGLAVKPFYQKYRESNRYFMCDSSEAMIKECKENFEDGIQAGIVECVCGDFCELKMPEKNSLVLSILSMQFMPTAYRQTMLKRIHDSIVQGGISICRENYR